MVDYKHCLCGTVTLQQTAKLISAQKLSHKHNNKDLSHLQLFSFGIRVKLHPSYIFKKGCPLMAHIPYISGTLSDIGVCKHWAIYSRTDIAV